MRHAYAGSVAPWKAAAEQVDQLLPLLTPEAVVSVEAALAMTGIILGANEPVERALERAERIESEWGFRGQRLYALATKASYLFQRGRLDAARTCVEELAKNQDFHPARRVGALVAAHVSVALGDDGLWQRFAPDVLREAREHLNDPDCLFILGACAGVLAMNGDLAAAQTDLRSAIRSLEYAAPEAMYVVINAARLLPSEDFERVAELTAASVRDESEIQVATLALVQATIASRSGRADEAATIGEAAAQRYAALGWPLLEASAHEVAGNPDRAVALYRAAGAEGEVRRLSEPERNAASNGRTAGLSAREREVASLIASGLRNAEIAKQLGVGKKTVEKHLSSVFEKLGVRSRAHVVAVMASEPNDRDA